MKQLSTLLVLILTSCATFFPMPFEEIEPTYLKIDSLIKSSKYKQALSVLDNTKVQYRFITPREVLDTPQDFYSKYNSIFKPIKGTFTIGGENGQYKYQINFSNKAIVALWSAPHSCKNTINREELHNCVSKKVKYLFKIVEGNATLEDIESISSLSQKFIFSMCQRPVYKPGSIPSSLLSFSDFKTMFYRLALFINSSQYAQKAGNITNIYKSRACVSYRREIDEENRNYGM